MRLSELGFSGFRGFMGLGVGCLKPVRSPSIPRSGCSRPFRRAKGAVTLTLALSHQGRGEMNQSPWLSLIEGAGRWIDFTLTLALSHQGRGDEKGVGMD